VYRTSLKPLAACRPSARKHTEKGPREASPAFLSPLGGRRIVGALAWALREGADHRILSTTVAANSGPMPVAAGPRYRRLFSHTGPGGLGTVKATRASVPPQPTRGPRFLLVACHQGKATAVDRRSRLRVIALGVGPSCFFSARGKRLLGSGDDDRTLTGPSALHLTAMMSPALTVEASPWSLQP
jgi:hypothetical protein